MFELNGDVLTVEDIQAAADSLNMSYDDAFAKLTKQGLIQPTSTNNMDLDTDQQPKKTVKLWGGLVPIEVDEEKVDPDDLPAYKQIINAFTGAPERAFNKFENFRVALADPIQDMFGDEYATYYLKSTDLDKSIPWIANMMKFDFGDYTAADLVDPQTKERIKFNQKAYDEKGVDAPENKRFFELLKMHREGGFESVIALAPNETYEEATRTFSEELQFQKGIIDERVKNFKPIKDPNVTGFTDAMKKGELDDMVSTGLSFVTDMTIDVVAAIATRGISMAGTMFGMGWNMFNDEKSKALYGEDDPDRVKKLIENNEEELAIPATLSALGFALERIGMKQVVGAIMKRAATMSVPAVMLKSGSVEGGTEYMQGLIEEFNRQLGSQGNDKDVEKATEKTIEFATSDRALDNLFAGIIGGSGLAGGSATVQAAFRADETSNQFVNEQLKNLKYLQEAEFRATSRRKKKQFREAINQTTNDLVYFLKKNRDKTEYLSKEQSESLENLIGEKRKATKELKDLRKLFKKGIISKEAYDQAVLDKRQEVLDFDAKMQEIKNDANMKLVMQNLDGGGKLVKDIKNINQKVYKTEAEFFKAMLNEYLAMGKTVKDFEADTKGFSIPGIKIGNTMLINAEEAARTNKFGVGVHEVAHMALKAKIQTKDGTGNLSVDGERIVKQFIEDLSSKEKEYIEDQLESGKYKVNADGTAKQFKEYGEEYLAFYAQGAREGKFTKNAIQKAGNNIAQIFRTETEFESFNFENADQTRAFLNALVEDSKEGIYRQEFVEMAREGATIEDSSVKKSMTAKEKATVEKNINKLGKEGLLGENFVEQAEKLGKGMGKKLFEAEFDDIYKRIQNEGYLDKLIAAQYKAKTVPRNFVKKVYSELTSHAKNFNPEINDSYFIWLNSQIGNKATQVYNREYEVDQTTAGRARNIGETTQEGEIKVQVAADTDTALKALETEDLSIVGQTKKEAQETRSKVSKFRKQLGFETGGEFYNRVLQSAKKSLLLAYNKTKNITDKSERAVAIRELIRKEYFTKGLTSDLFKPLKNFLGTAQYLNNLVEYKEAFINAMSTADLVQMERKVAEHERVFTIFDKKLTKIEEVQDAVNRDLLPPDAINAIKKGQAVNLYKKRMPTDSEIVAFANQPAINPVTGQRSGLKGTRKDGFAKAMANSLLLDAVMQVRQSAEVVEALQDDAVALGDEATLAGKIGREVDVKFSREAKEIVEATKPITKTMGANQIRKAGIAIDEIVRTIEKEGVDNSVVSMFEDIKSLIQQGLSVQEVAEIAWNRNGYLFEDASKYGVEGSLLTGVFDKKHLAQILANAKSITEAQIKQIGFIDSVNFLQKLKSPNAVIDWLKTYSKSLRTAKVIYNGQTITTNEQVHDLLIAPLGIEGFSVRKTGRGNTKIVYNGKDINTYKKIIEIKQDARGSYNTISQEAKSAIKAVVDIVKSDKSKEIKKSLIKLMGVDQVGTLRKMAKPGIMFWNFKGETILDHRPTINDITKKIYETINNPTSQAVQELESYLNNTYVNLIPKSLDTEITKAGFKNKGGMEIMSNFTLKNLIADEIYDNLSNTSVNFTKENNSIQKSFQFARSAKKPTKGISILDFDDTLATSKSLVKFTKPDGTEGTLTPEQYAATYEDLTDLGYKFDFSEFSKVVDGKPAPLLNKAKKLAGKFGTDNMFVLTARPADSAPAIKAFLDQNGLNIPLKNITGLGNSTAEAKALWVAGKAADGYNDFYFADDALKNVQAVKNMLDQFDVKSKVQQAKVNFSRTMNDEFNQMLERTKGVPFDESFSRARALKLGKNKGKFQIFVPPAADDFEGLLYYFVGKGEQGNKDLEFFKQSVIDPFSRAYTELDQSRQTIINDWDRLRKNHKEVTKKLGDMMPASEFTFDNAIRVYLYNKAGHTVPGLSEQEVSNMVERVETDKALLAFAENLQSILQLDDVYVKPNEYWIAGSTSADVHEVSERIRRAEFLGEWIENKNEIFNEANLNKIEATYGSKFRSALEDVLYRMETGRTRSEGSKDAIASKWMRWLNNSVGAIMFINTKSALLQTISMVNYVNYVDNNPLQAARAFANQKQYWSDFSMIFNSDFLKQRRKGLKTDVQTAEIASAVANATNKAQAAVAYLLKKGFLPTQMADSFAIAAGGATFYRNRIKTYLNEGLSQKEAEEKAFNDFRNSTEESQQSARPDRISQQQVSNAGRLLLNFQNYPMQQARLFKKAILGLSRGTGDKKQHLSRIAFYGFAQNIIFLSLQNALFAMLFDSDDEEKKQELLDTKTSRILNGMVDTMLRGSGIAGGVIATAKNTILRAIQELDKKGRANEANVILEATNLSPAIGSKLRKINKGFRTYKYNKDAINEMSKLNINNPLWTTAAPVIEGVTNAPTDRAIRLINQVREGFNTDNTVAQRMSLLLGFSPYEIGVDPNKEVKEAKKRGQEKGKAKKKQCRAFTASGKPCSNMTTNESGLCYAHE
jgi:hypothetical protein|tara:strand:+ start:14935 stop:22341 length:7407 start_codon:yes stop_codon:yes gene_type:complete